MPNAGPISVDRFPEVDDEGDVDVEQCSDSETTPSSRHGSSSRKSHHSSRATPGTPSDEERLTPEPATTKNTIKGSCNSDDLRPVQCHLETKELWDKFHDLGTEMIITKTGRVVNVQRNQGLVITGSLGFNVCCKLCKIDSRINTWTSDRRELQTKQLNENLNPESIRFKMCSKFLKRVRRLEGRSREIPDAIVFRPSAMFSLNGLPPLEWKLPRGNCWR
ncbi:hypothetical protein pipiens_008008 [Culex pipiens pipiens]|uniref:T-box domain-containing protein n=1 Tax=Culex pipiens pipiens TaxID=38569 RepID=A0ABD1DIY0_CULPP